MSRPAARRAGIMAAALAATALVATGCNVSLQSLPKYSSQHGPFIHVMATFDNVLNLPADAAVRSGVATVGEVGSIKAHDFHAEVVLDIKTSVKLPVGTRAEVQFDDPLGDEYVELIAPSTVTHGYLRNGSVLSLAQTQSAPSIADTLAALSTVLNGGGISQLHTIISQLDLTFKGNEPRIRDLLHQIDGTFASLASHDSDIDVALDALSRLSVALNKGTPQIVAGIDALQPAINVLAGQNSELYQLLANVNQLAGVADDVLDKTGNATVADIKALLPVVNQLVGVEGRIKPDLAALAKFEVLTPKIAPGNSLQVSLKATAVLNGTANVSAALRSGAAAAVATTGGGQTAVSALLGNGLP